MSFADLGLSPAILEAVVAQGYTTPSPIQAAAIPAVLEGKDIMAAAQTGTGKTAGFTLPILEMRGCFGRNPRPFIGFSKPRRHQIRPARIFSA